MDLLQRIISIQYEVHATNSTRVIKHTYRASERSRILVTRRSYGALLIICTLLTGVCLVPHARALSQTDAITAALNWLLSKQLSDGSYGSFTEPETAPAAYALWIKYQDSTNVLLSFRWLKNQLQNSTTWFWGGSSSPSEADVPGEILYTFAQTKNLSMLNLLSSVATNLTKFQQTNGGFLGYQTSTGQHVTSSVDTAMALLGLVDANSLTLAKEQSAINYLFTLQDSDGSFNLTKTVRSDALYSLGPEPVSITALVVLALIRAGQGSTEPHVSAGVSYLAQQSSVNFNGHVYAAALSLLVFAAFSDAGYASTADGYLLANQNTDGGFRDTIRLSTGSNPLDTGWAAAALQIGGPLCCVAASGGGRGMFDM